MNTTNDDLYYGLPEEIWKNLCVEAEETMVSDDRGTYLVGVYPIGGRIYGIDSAAPGILCLCINPGETLLDPLSDESDWHKVYTIGNLLSNIVIVDLFRWIQWILGRRNELHYGAGNLIHAIPCFHEFIYQEDSIEPIINSVREYLRTINYNPKLSEQIQSYGLGSENYYGSYLRTQLILSTTKNFVPNMNTEWGPVYNFTDIHPVLSEEIVKEDLDMIDSITYGRKIKIPSMDYRNWAYSTISGLQKARQQDNSEEELAVRVATMELYRQLV